MALKNNIILAHAISAINVALTQRLSYVDIITNNMVSGVLMVLLQQGVIQSVAPLKMYNACRYYRIFLAYDSFIYARVRIELIPKGSSFASITHKQLSYLYKHGGCKLLILTTPLGVMAAEEAFCRGVGGSLLLRICIGDVCV